MLRDMEKELADLAKGSGDAEMCAFLSAPPDLSVLSLVTLPRMQFSMFVTPSKYRLRRAGIRK